MQNIGTLLSKIFLIQNEREFEQCALDVFHYQVENNIVYRTFIQYLNIDVQKIQHWNQVPFLPIELFKTQKIKSFEGESSLFFTSSGTTGKNTSTHFIFDISVYEQSFLKTFELFLGNPEDYVIIALLPNYLEQTHSSLIYMISKFIERMGDKRSGFYKEVTPSLIDAIKELDEAGGKKLMLFGVTYSLLDLIEKEKFTLKNTIIFETGGMKGLRKEMVRDELHTILCDGFGVDAIASEYGMTELFSQAYSLGKGIFSTPPWMKICIHETNDPLSLAKPMQTGGISVIDLANIHTCSFIATQDLGKLHCNGTFEVLGRFDNSDIRGCNLLLA